jgi:hypothetical protein
MKLSALEQTNRILRVFVLFSALAVLQGTSQLLHAQEKSPMTVDNVLALKSVGDPQISPDGRWVAYVVT